MSEGKIAPTMGESVEELLHDHEFQARWAYCGPRILRLLQVGQLEYAEQCDNDEDVGKFTKHTLDICKLLRRVTALAKTAPPKRKRLHPIKP